MILKVKFSELIIDQEFFVYEEDVGNRRKVFKKLAPRRIPQAPPGRIDCRFCKTPLNKWVNATMVSKSNILHYCPDDEVFIVNKSNNNLCA